MTDGCEHTSNVWCGECREHLIEYGVLMSPEEHAAWDAHERIYFAMLAENLRGMEAVPNRDGTLTIGDDYGFIQSDTVVDIEAFNAGVSR